MAEEPPAQMIVRHETSARLIDAWVNSKKAKADNIADRELAHAESKLNKKKVSLESKEKTIELNAGMNKQREIERIKNEEATSKKKFDERTVGIEAKREQNKHKIDHMAQKFRSTGTLPKKCFGFCSDD